MKKPNVFVRFFLNLAVLLDWRTHPYGVDISYGIRAVNGDTYPCYVVAYRPLTAEEERRREIEAESMLTSF